MSELSLDPPAVALIGLVGGACLGSFLNVCASRIPHGLSVVHPGSRCPSCKVPIPWFYNLPILGWIALRGRASCCGEKISARYLAVELFLGLLFGWIFWKETQTPEPGALIYGCIFAWIMVAVVVIDAETMLIPDRFSMGGALLGLILSIFLPSLHGFPTDSSLLVHFLAAKSSALGLLIGAGMLYWIGAVASRLFGRDALGEGDVKLLGCVGAFCGWEGAVFCIFGGAALGSVILLPVMLVEKWLRPSGTGAGKLSWGNEVPFGPFLALAALLYFFVLKEEVICWFDRVVGSLS